MKAVSDRTTDAFDNPAKAAYRERHVEVLRSVPELWDDAAGPGLRGSWLELMGTTGWRTLELLTSAGAIHHEQFVGVDLDLPRIEGYRARYPRARWLQGNVLDHVAGPELQDTSVVHYDGYETVDSPKLDHVAEQLRPVLRRSVDRHGAAVLIWNADLDASRLRRRSPVDALQGHAVALAEILREIGGDRRSFEVSGLLPGGQERVVGHLGFTGLVGAFEVYRGKPGGHRMACIRVVIR